MKNLLLLSISIMLFFACNPTVSKNVTDVTISDKNITLEIEGKTVKATPVTAEESAKLGLGGCDCGMQICHDTRVYVCRYKNELVGCDWYWTRVRCNE